jgi:hypothetical protein
MLPKQLRFLHPYLHFTGLLLMVVGLPFSLLLMSLSQFFVVGNWILEADFKTKWARFKSNKPAWLLCGIFILLLPGLLYTQNMNDGLKLVRINLPFFIFPFFLSSSAPLKKSWYELLLKLSFLSVFLASLACAFIGLPHWLNGEFSDIRQISIFISHIRFALLIDLSILIGLWILKFNPIPTKAIERWLIGIAIAWMLVFLFILQSLTGIAILLLLLLIGGISFVFKTYSLKRAVLFLSIPVLLFIGIFLLLNNSWKHYHTPDPKYSKPLALTTKLGNSYSHNFDIIENGHYINSYVCELELRDAWKLRSKLCIDSNDNKGHLTYSTLIRFLNSKGITKDAEGISSLSDKEVHFIEQGIANVNYTGLWGIRMRLYQLFWELDYNQRGGKSPIGYSVMMKWEFWKTSVNIIRNNPISGVGTGDVTDAFKEEYTTSNSWLNEKWRLTSHNYYLYIAVALGIPGLIIFLILISAPFILTVSQSPYFPLTIFFWIAIISMLTEDTLNTQAGASFVAFFYCFFLFSRPIIKSISSSSSSTSSED